MKLHEVASEKDPLIWAMLKKLFPLIADGRLFYRDSDGKAYVITSVLNSGIAQLGTKYLKVLFNRHSPVGDEDDWRLSSKMAKYIDLSTIDELFTLRQYEGGYILELRE